MSARDKVRTTIADEAAEWFVANRHGLPDAGQRAAFAAWLKSSPLNVEEYLGVALVALDLRHAADPGVSLEELLAQARSADDTNVRAIGNARAGGESARSARPAVRWRFAAVAAAVVVLSVVAFAVLRLGVDHPAEVRYATRHGEQITQRLADDSLLHLDTDTAVTVRYSRAQRVVEVERGQVLFEVVHEAGRPFRVVAGAAQVVDVGTRFDVYLQQNSTLVTVLEGQVLVSLVAAPQDASTGARSVPVHAGQHIRVADGMLLAQSTPAETQRTTAWLRRQITFEQEPLATVAAEFNRYNTPPIEIETPSLRGLAISGTFSADDEESFVAFLRSLEGVKVEITPTRVRVSRR